MTLRRLIGLQCDGRPRAAFCARMAVSSVRALTATLVGLSMMASSVTVMAADESPPQRKIDFARQVQPIFAKHCYACHGPDEAESGLKLSEQQSAFAEADSGDHTIVAGDVEASALIARISSEDEFERMPPEGDPLSPEQIEVVTQWIQQGADWSKHWAFEPMSGEEPPQVSGNTWSQHPIDAFVFDGLVAADLKPSEPASRATLIRRAYYDLTGLPPTAQQVQDFVSDPDPKAFEKLIDQLLQSPHYGERWGRHWLDLVRYAETNSYERDGPKPNAYKYRDYVIRSFNEDKPYDRFIREQLAGDELDEVTQETLIATGYYRLGIWDDEPADPLLALYDGVDDIIMTTRPSVLGADLQLRSMPRPQDRSDSAKGLLSTGGVFRRCHSLGFAWQPTRQQSNRRFIPGGEGSLCGERPNQASFGKRDSRNRAGGHRQNAWTRPARDRRSEKRSQSGFEPKAKRSSGRSAVDDLPRFEETADREHPVKARNCRRAKP